MKPRQIIGLDLIRFCAATMVMAFHLAYWGPAAEDASTHQLIGSMQRHPAVWFGWVGVEIFFVLSGFVIAYSAEHASPFKFFQSRFTRLAPAAWLCASLSLAFALPAGLFSASDGIVRWLRSVLFVPNGPWVDGAYWTLAIEISFYALVFALLRMKKFRYISPVASTLGLLSGAYWLTWALFPQLIDALPGKRILALLLVRHGCFFAAGVMMWLGVKRWTPFRLGTLALCLAAGAIEITAETGAKATAVGASLAPAAPIATWIIAVGFIYLSTAHSFFDDHLARFARPIRVLGLATYPLYLLHQNVGAVVMSRILPVLPALASLAIGMAVSMVLAVIVASRLEPWLQSKVRAWVTRLDGHQIFGTQPVAVTESAPAKP